MSILQRCKWAESDPLLREYHDKEWGVPVRDSRAMWEMLMLEGFQAGLSWLTILRKRDAFRKAFRDFDPEKVARFKEKDIERLLKDEGIIRSRAKIEATIAGARIFLADGEGWRLCERDVGACGWQADTRYGPCAGEDAAVRNHLC